MIFFVHSARKRQYIFYQTAFLSRSHKKKRSLSQNLKTGNGKQDLSLTRFTFTFILQSFQIKNGAKIPLARGEHLALIA